MASATNDMNVGPLGIIGGSSFLDSHFLASFEVISVNTDHGPVLLRHSRDKSVYFVQRHGANPSHPYSPPHLINKKAIALALHSLGVRRVIGFGSVGSLKKTLPICSLILPDDTYCPHEPITLYQFSKQGHHVPGFNSTLRDNVLAMLKGKGQAVIPTGVYAQTTGPRFETAAEIKALAAIADVVGMTCAHESTLMRELDIAYCVICMVDNMANGVLDSALTTHDFHEGVKRNLATMEKILGFVLQTFANMESATANSLNVPIHTNPATPSPIDNLIIPRELPDTRRKVDLIIHARYIVPVEPEGVFTNHSLIVDKGKIVDMLPTVATSSKYISDDERDMSAGHCLMPGFINAHTHAGMTLLRGYSDDLCLSDWLQHHIWPAEAVFCSPAFVRDSTQLALAEMIRSGTTTINEMYFYPEIVANVCAEAGVRANIGLVAFDFPTNYASNFEDYVVKGEAARRAVNNGSIGGKDSVDVKDRITFSIAPHAPYTVCDANWKLCGEYSKANNCTIHTHLHETKAEVVDSLNGNPTPSRHRSENLLRPIENLNRMGLVNEQLIAVHMTQLTDEEITLLAATGASVVHCPSSNLKLASGFCPIQKLVTAGVNVALGTDSSASNNSLDMFSEMRTGSLVAKAVSDDATAIPASTALRMATLNGAKALAIDGKTGSLTIGKSADFIAVSLADVDMQPLYKIQSHLVYCASRDRVTDSWVNGNQIMRSRELITLDVEEIIKRCQKWTEALVQHKHEHAETEEHKQRIASSNKRKQSLTRSSSSNNMTVEVEGTATKK